MSMTMRRIARMTVLLSAAALAGAGCTVNEVDAPPLMGPSELALSVAVTATPDTVTEDGASQSVIDIVARDENGQPRANVQVRVTVDQGRLSASTVSTGSNGRVSVTFTAPVTQFPGFDAGNVAPNPFNVWLFSSHPPTIVRIRMAEKWLEELGIKN